MQKLRAIVIAALLSAAIPGTALGVSVSEVAGNIGTPGFAASIESLGSASSVGLLEVASLEGAEDRAVLDEALAAKSQEIAALRAEVDQSDAARMALEGQGLTSANVVGIGSASDGGVMLIVDETAELSIAPDPGIGITQPVPGMTAGDAANALHDPESASAATNAS